MEVFVYIIFYLLALVSLLIVGICIAMVISIWRKHKHHCRKKNGMVEFTIGPVTKK